jgi:hypothetical protein
MKPANENVRCPAAILAAARLRIRELAEIYYRPARLWLLRWIAPKSFIRRGPARFADVRWLAECNLEARTCGGHITGRWLIGETQTLAIDLRLNLRGEVPLDSIYDPLATIVFNFAITTDGGKCVLMEVDLDGNETRIVYELPHGLDSETFGPMIGDKLCGKIPRGKWDLCLPEDFKSEGT